MEFMSPDETLRVRWILLKVRCESSFMGAQSIAIFNLLVISFVDQTYGYQKNHFSQSKYLLNQI